MGNLTRDPQLKFLPSQMAVAEFGVAVNRKFRTAAGEDREEVTFVDVAAFGKTGEIINKFFTKGKPIFIEGRLKYDSWDDKNGGGKRSKLTVVAERFEFVGGRDQQGGGGGGGSYEGGGYGGNNQGYDDVGYEAPPPPRENRAPMNRGPGPNRGPAAAPRQAPQQQPSQPAEPPFAGEQQFTDDEIPF